MSPSFSEYPRDLAGYGRNPPDPRWPGNARVAVQFVINFEEGGERDTLHGDATSEAFLTEVLGTRPWPGKRHMNVESMFEYGSRAGFWRLWRLFTARKLPVTVFGVATALARNPQIVAAMREAGWDIACHGLKWIDYRDFTDARGRRPYARRDPHPHRGDRRPAAWAGTPAALPNTRLKLVLEDGGFLYSSDSYADDLPYWVQRTEGPAPHHPLFARCQRHALHQCAGLSRRRSVLHLSARHLRLPLRRGRRRAENDVDRPALPAWPAARAAPQAWPNSWITSPNSIASGSRRGSISRGIGTASISRSPTQAPVSER